MPLPGIQTRGPLDDYQHAGGYHGIHPTDWGMYKFAGSYGKADPLKWHREPAEVVTLVGWMGEQVGGRTRCSGNNCNRRAFIYIIE